MVATHPRHNVIVVTHSYLDPAGKIYNKSDYGDTAPTVLARDLILAYPNIRLVLSGHHGTSFAYRVDNGRHGNIVDTFMTAMHSNTTNPVRLVEINTRTNSLRTWLYAPWDDTQYPSATMQLRGRSWLRWALFTA